MNQEDFFFKKLSENQVDSDPSFSETVDKYFWELSDDKIPMHPTAEQIGEIRGRIRRLKC